MTFLVACNYSLALGRSIPNRRVPSDGPPFSGRREPLGERVQGVARVEFEAGRLWSGDQAATVRFLNRPHLLLGGRTPLDVARESTAGADLVVRIIGEARAGVAV